MSDTDKTPMPYVDRDISWIYFNHRILQEAGRDEVPLLERVSFLGIYSNNLDEFFRVRMATLSRIAELPSRSMASESRRAAELFQRISSLETMLASEYADCVKEVTCLLADNGIRIVNELELDEEQRHYVRCLFRKKVSGFISPVWLSKIGAFGDESDSHIYLAVELTGPQMKTDCALIELPTARCGRFISLPSRIDAEGRRTDFVIYLDDVVRFALPMIFPGMGYTGFRAFSFKFTKDAEIEVDNDMHMGPMDKIAKAVSARKKGAALRVLYDAEMPQQILKQLIHKMKLDKLDSIQHTGRYQNHKDFMAFPSCGRSDLKYKSWPSMVPPELKSTDSLMQLIAEKDRFVHVPYMTFDYIVRLLQEAAISKNVKSIKITLYRLAKDSEIAQALICAARNGKKVTAVVELLARFDESSNISYAREMQEAGVNVVFGVEGLKIHSKIALIAMRNGRDIAIVGTGNFHEGNARVYTDYFLMTADRRITDEVGHVFDIIKRPYRQQEFKHLLVSPFTMRHRFIDLIRREAENAREGKEAWIKIKINHITDEEMVSELYKASEAGVKIEILVRGNCSLVTDDGGPGRTIHAAGIIDRYLEHSRIFIFCAGGKRKTFLGSADWMPRNLDRRIEVVTEVFDQCLRDDLLRTVEFGLNDNDKARVVDGSGRNVIVSTDHPEKFRSQLRLYEEYCKDFNKDVSTVNNK